MFNNYLYLLRGLEELKDTILGQEIVDIYTQEKDKLFVKIPLKSDPDFTLILSTHTQTSYFSIKPDHKKARKNTKDFFIDCIPSKIIDLLIAQDDRIIKLVLTRGAIYFLIRGVKSNVHFLHDNSVDSFKKTKENLEKLTVSGIMATEFISPQESFNRIRNDVLKYDRDYLLKYYRFWDKSLSKEIQENDWNNKLIKILDDVMNNEIRINLINDSDVSFHPVSLNNSQKGQSFYYSSYFDALSKFISLKHVVKRDVSVKKEIEKYLSRELERISNKLNEVKAKIEKGSKEKEYSNSANLLLTNINNIRKGMESIKLYDAVNESEITIILDKTLSPNKNIDKYFEMSKSEKINYQKSKTLFSELEYQYSRFINLQQKLNNSHSYDEIISLKKEIGIKSKMELQNKSEKSKYRQFIIENKYHLYVGKNSKNNDVLTTRFAKQNDLWFHARSVSGSHVVLRIENTKESVPKNIIKKAASIAAYYSKAKTSKLVSVSYTFKKYVTKRKDLEPGQVILLREQVILVQPEIPDGCLAVD